MECECSKSRNSMISFAVLLFGAITVVTYLFLFSIRPKILYDDNNELIWILIFSIIFGALATAIVILINYLIYKR